MDRISRTLQNFIFSVEANIVSADIKIYAKERLRKMGERRGYCDRSSDEWPPKPELDALVSLSANLFIYAATVCEYVTGGGDMRLRLTKVTRSSATHSSQVKTNQLDHLYDTILEAAYESADAKEREILTQILRAVISARSPLPIDSLAVLLCFSRDEVYAALSSVHSVILIPDPRDDSTPITTVHTSFPDYLSDHHRSGEHFLVSAESHRDLTYYCLRLMQQRLQKNICCLDGRPPNAKIPSETIEDCIPNGLTYACIHWASHITELDPEAPEMGNLTKQLRNFFDDKVLQWIECLSLSGHLKNAIRSLERLENWAMASHSLCSQIVSQQPLLDTTGFASDNLQCSTVCNGEL